LKYRAIPTIILEPTKKKFFSIQDSLAMNINFRQLKRRRALPHPVPNVFKSTKNNFQSFPRRNFVILIMVFIFGSYVYSVVTIDRTVSRFYKPVTNDEFVANRYAHDGSSASKHSQEETKFSFRQDTRIDLNEKDEDQNINHNMQIHEDETVEDEILKGNKNPNQNDNTAQMEQSSIHQIASVINSNNNSQSMNIESITDSAHHTNASINLLQAKNSNGQQNKDQTNVHESICRYYLAPSSIPNSGWGIFTAVDIQEDERAFPAEVVIPIMDIDDHNNYKEDYEWMPRSYVWQPDIPGLEGEGNDVDGWIPGPGAMPNCYSSLNNIDVSEYASRYDSGLHRSVDPGAGAFTTTTYEQAYALEDIKAGTELFVSYGESWFISRTDTFGHIPLSNDYTYVDTAVTNILNYRNDSLATLSDVAFGDLWELTKQITSDGLRTRNAFHSTNDKDLLNLQEFGSARSSLPQSIREISWIQKNGLCIDNLSAKLSNIKQAGKGAFSTRAFQEGDFVAPLPLIHIPDKDTVNMYDLNTTDKDGNKIKGDFIGKQLITNYCFGHSSSTLFLCSYGSSVNFVNHDSKSPNVKIRWSQFSGTHNEWYNKTVDELGKEQHAGLMFEYVAIRDIAPREEILLDYGHEWEEAWKKHVNDFKPSMGSKNYTSALYYRNDPIVRTEKEDPYPDNVVVSCFYRNYFHNSVLKKGQVFRRKFSRNDYHSVSRPCTITSRYSVGNVTYYAATINHNKNGHKSRRIPEGQVHKLTGIPRDGIEFRDEAYTADFHIKGVFRHPIGIPDEIFPPAWKNI